MPKVRDHGRLKIANMIVGSPRLILRSQPSYIRSYFMRILFSCLVVVVFLTGSFEMTVRSDEGMWLLDEPPRALLQEKYGFDLTDEWLEHARLSSIRFNNG